MQNIVKLLSIGAISFGAYMATTGGALAHSDKHNSKSHHGHHYDKHHKSHKKHHVKKVKKSNFHHRYKRNGYVVYDSYHTPYGRKVVYYNHPSVYYKPVVKKRNYRHNNGGLTLSFNFD